jgi:microspherule protein 1
VSQLTAANPTAANAAPGGTAVAARQPATFGEPERSARRASATSPTATARPATTATTTPAITGPATPPGRIATTTAEPARYTAASPTTETRPESTITAAATAREAPRARHWLNANPADTTAPAGIVMDSAVRA